MSIISQLPHSMKFPSGGTDDVALTLSSLHLSQTLMQRIFDPKALRNFNATLPISRIPVELLCEIFNKVVTERSSHSEINRGPGPFASRLSVGDPLFLGHVCSNWRNVALKFSTLWSTIVIQKLRQSRLDLTKLWLERASDQPLKLTLQYTGISDGVDIPIILELLSAFISRSAFWKKIDFILPLEVLVPLHQMIINAHRCERLESVNFTASFAVSRDLREFSLRKPNWKRPYLEDIWAFFNSSPALRDVTWRDIFQTIIPKGTPFEQITTINLRDPLGMEDLLFVLSQCPNVGNLQASIDPVIPRIDAPSPTLPVFIHDQLQTLRIYTSVPMSPLFSNISLPSLRDLFISSNTYPLHPVEEYLDDPSTFQAFLQRSKCRLQKLTLLGNGFPEDSLERYITSSDLQWLTYFDSGGPISDRIASLFLQESLDGRQIIMPLLEGLHLGSCNTTDGILTRMVSSRWHAPLTEGQSHPLGVLQSFRLFPASRFSAIDEEFLTKYENV